MNIAKNSNEKSSAIVRLPVALEIVEYARTIADRTAILSDHVLDKLRPVMQSDFPRECEPEQKDVEFPPLFADLRNSLRGIAASLDMIEHVLSRTEL